MTVEDQFPVGMRVLAVDDDPVCLKLLESLLIRCQYNVTTTGQAITALRLLRENKNKFDLVISDVHMPDMDGFKLLELVGLEMDLPVIMLSANGEKQAVMKGIAHGACDYLLKPVRIEELKNIWQHVIRRRRFDKRSQRNHDDSNTFTDGEKTQIGGFEDGKRANDQTEKTNKKRKDQNENDEFDSEDDMLENDDNSAQKKPRVVWTVELHRKFVAAVNHMGIDKAVPRKILDLMNVDKLTRENVASHLQKYRLYLKRISAVNQQANLTAAFGGRNSSYITSLNGFRGYQPVVGSRQSSALASFQPNGVLGRMNAQAPIGINGLLPSQAIHIGGINKNSGHNIHDAAKFQNLSLPRNDQATLLHGVPTVLHLDGSQKLRTMPELNGNFTAIPSQNGANKPLLSRELYNSPVSNSLGTELQNPSQFPQVYRCSDTGQVAITSSQHAGNTLSKLAPVKQEDRPYSLSVGPVHGAARSTRAQNEVNSLFDSRMSIPGQDPSFTNFRVEDSLGISNTSYPNRGLNDAALQYQTVERGLYNSSLASDVISSTVLDTSLVAQHFASGKSDSQLLGLDDYAMDDMRLQNVVDSTGCNFDELYAMIKPEQNDEGDKSIDTEFGSEVYSLGTCI